MDDFKEREKLVVDDLIKRTSRLREKAMEVRNWAVSFRARTDQIIAERKDAGYSHAEQVLLTVTTSADESERRAVGQIADLDSLLADLGSIKTRLEKLG